MPANVDLLIADSLLIDAGLGAGSRTSNFNLRQRVFSLVVEGHGNPRGGNRAVVASRKPKDCVRRRADHQTADPRRRPGYLVRSITQTNLTWLAHSSRFYALQSDEGLASQCAHPQTSLQL